MFNNLSNLLKKIVFLICVILLLFSNTALYIDNEAQAASMTDGLMLQTLVDLTPSGGTLVLERDYIGKRDGWGYSETVTLNKPITIAGLSSTNRSQVDNIRFEINSADVTIKDLRFEKGDHPHGLCITILNKEADRFTLINCVFDTYGNYSAFSDVGSANDGGHIYITKIQDVTIKNCKFKYGRAQYSGGSMYIEGVTNLNITGCEFTGNISKSSSSDGTAIGGAVYAKSVTNLLITNCTFTDNMSNKAAGGAYFVKCKSVVVTDCTFSQNKCVPKTNTAYELIGYGGALVLRGSEVTLNGCEFSGNSSYQGGGIFASKSNLTLLDTDFSQNDVKTHIIINPDLIRTIINTAYGVFTLDIQGFIEKIVTYILTESTCPGLQIDDFLAGTGKMGGEGGGVYSLDSNISITSGDFTNNYAQKSGGGIYIASGSIAKIADVKYCTFLGNNSGSNGGAIALLSTGTLIQDCLVQDNTSSVGGGVYSVDDCIIKDTDFISNSASAGGAVSANVINNTQEYEGCYFSNNVAQGGGAIYAHGSTKDAEDQSVNLSDCKVTMEDCEFNQNYSTNYGGAIAIFYATAKINENTFIQNNANGNGGALYFQAGAKATITKGLFDKNSAGYGGAICNDGSLCYIYKSRFIGNIGSSGAGAVHDIDGRTEALNCLFRENKTSNQLLNGGSVFELDATAKAIITNCTIVDNYTTNALTQNMMCAVYAKNGADADITNNIFLSNTVIEKTSEFDIVTADTSTVNATHNICGLSGEGNVQTTTSIFLDYGNLDYHLRYDFLTGMGAVEQGTVDADTQNKDLDLEKRLVDADGDGIARPDLGAYEAAHVLITFSSSHPQSTAHGTISGATEQWIAIGQTVDMQAVTVVPDDGWQFDGWETVDNKDVSESDVFFDGAQLYAKYKNDQIAVTFEFDPNMLQIAEVRQGTLAEIDASTSQYVLDVNKYDSPYYPTMAGVNGWEFNNWDTMPSSVTTPVIITAQATATVSYDFGDNGYYEVENTRTAFWTTTQVSPLESPSQENIKIYGQYSFVGWSETENGAIITLPASVTEPTTFYAIYEEIDVSLTVNINGGRYIDGFSDPSGIYSYGTEISPGSFGVLPPLGNSVFIGVTDQNDNVVNMESYALLEDTVLTWHYGLITDLYPPMPRMYKVEVEYLDDNGKTEWIKKYFTAGTEVDLDENTVYPEQGYYFAGWRDKNGNYLSDFSINADTIVYPIFNKIVYPFSMAILGSGDISPFSSIMNIESNFSSSESVSGNYNSGTIIWLGDGNASAGAGNTFVGYRDELGNMVSVVQVNGERNISAIFEAERCLVTLQAGANGVINSAQSIICDYGDVINLGAIDLSADSGYVLSHWEKSGQTVEGSYTVQGDTTLTAVFDQETAVLNVSSGANGSVLPGLSGTYPIGSTVTALSSYAVPDENYEFIGFTDSDGNIVSSVVIDSDMTITAKFEYQQYRLTICTMQNGSITGVYNTQWYDVGTTVNMPPSAQTPSGYTFTGWFDDGMENINSVIMVEDILVYAVFESEAELTTASVTESSAEVNYTPTPTPTPAPTIPALSETNTSTPSAIITSTHEPKITVSTFPIDTGTVTQQGNDNKLAWFLWVLIIVAILLISFIAFRIYVAIKIR